MAPKAQQKRRAREDDSSPARHNKKAGKNKREVTYDTYEEALDGESHSDRVTPGTRAVAYGPGGVEYEEKGERYRDGDRVSGSQKRMTQMLTPQGSTKLRTVFGALSEGL